MSHITCVKLWVPISLPVRHGATSCAGVNLGGGGGGAQAPSGLAIAPPRFIPKALRNGKV